MGRDQNVDVVGAEAVEAEVGSVESVGIEDVAEVEVNEVAVDVAEDEEGLVVALATIRVMTKMRTVVDLVVALVEMQLVITLVMVDLVVDMEEMMTGLTGAEEGAVVVEDPHVGTVIVVTMKAILSVSALNLPLREQITMPHLHPRILVGSEIQTLVDLVVDSVVVLVVVLVGQKVMKETDRLVVEDSGVVDAAVEEVVVVDPVNLTDAVAMTRVKNKDLELLLKMLRRHQWKLIQKQLLMLKCCQVMRTKRMQKKQFGK